MRCPRTFCLALVVALALSGCSYGDNMLDRVAGTSAPTNETASTGDPIPIAPSAAEGDTVSTASLPAPNPAAGAGSSGTFVGQRVQSLRTDLGQLESRIAQHQQALNAARQGLSDNAARYFSTIAAVNTRLQAGTTPGNPNLVAQWSQAQSTLDQMDAGVTRLNTIANDIASDSSFGNYLLSEVRSAYNLQGGVEADRDALRQTETQTSQALAVIDQLLNGLSDDIARQANNVARERSNLVTLALAIQNGQLYGPSLANQSFATAPVSPAAAATAAPQPESRGASRSARGQAPAAGERPLVIIRFDQPNVNYQQPLYNAVSRALERKPTASFTIEAVSPNGGTPAQVALNSNSSRQKAENVLRSLTNMGLPADRVSLAATMSPDIQSTEVRVYVR